VTSISRLLHDSRSILRFKLSKEVPEQQRKGKKDFVKSPTQNFHLYYFSQAQCSGVPCNLSYSGDRGRRMQSCWGKVKNKRKAKKLGHVFLPSKHKALSSIFNLQYDQREREREGERGREMQSL
jgi:hypothetical protein